MESRKQKQKASTGSNTVQSANEGNQSTAVKSRGMSGTTFAIVALSMLLVASVILGLTGAFFTGSADVAGTITLGNPVTIGVTQGGASVTTLTFNGSAMPGTVYDQAIAVSQPVSTSDSVVRAKVTLSNTDEASVNVDIVTAGGWTKGEDNYYYYGGVFKAGESHDFITSITVPTSLTNVDANKTYAVNVVVEAIQHANGAAKTVWTTAPSEWKTSYGSGTAV